MAAREDVKTYGILAFFLVFYCISLSPVNCGVPVLIWESSKTSDSVDLVPALTHLDSDDFSNRIVKKVHTHKPLIVLFLEETLSVEDFSWQDNERKGSFPKLKNITAMSSKVEFMPSVEDPVSALNDLVSSHSYVWKKYDKNSLPVKSQVLLQVQMTGPSIDEDRPDLLRKHDTDIADIYSQLLAKHGRICAIFTGKQSSWVELETNRVRRAADEIVYENTNVKIRTSKAPVLTVGKETYNLPISPETQSDLRKNTSKVIVNVYPENKDIKITLAFRFERNDSYWRFVDITSDVSNKGVVKTNILTPETELKGKLDSSYVSKGSVFFGNLDSSVNLVFEDLEAEMFKMAADVKTFNEPENEEGVYFTGPIWSGILISWLLIIILGWGITMLMDIKTMDRFDDPKGKTITIHGTE